MNLQKRKIKATISGELRDKDGRIIRTLPEVPANSFVLAFIDLLYKHLAASNATILETDGTSVSLASHSSDFKANALADDTTFGIVIGTGTNAVAIADNKLQTQVTANIAHSSVTVSAPATVGTTRQVDVLRTFTNNTGALLEIKEVGLYVQGGGANYCFCVDRSLYSVDVANGESITLRYRIKVTV